jgi:surface polysaccharide O-acyltransferase-like enzyme
MNTRESAIDWFRFFCIFWIVWGHHQPFLASANRFEYLLGVGINQGLRFVVTFFFIIAGYLWGKKINAGNRVDEIFFKYFNRLLALWLFWCLIFLIFPLDMHAIREYGILSVVKVPYWRLCNLYKENPLLLLFEGTRFHLWFIVAMIYALTISTILIKWNRGSWLIPVGLILYIFGLMAGAYSKTPIGVQIAFDTRDGPFYSTIFFGLGWYISSYKRHIHIHMIIPALVFLGGSILYMLENYLLFKYYNISVFHDYLLSTIPCAFGFAMMPLVKPSFGQNTFFEKMGVYTLGIYACHVLFLGLGRSLMKSMNHNFVSDLIIPIIIFVIVLITVTTCARIKVLRRFFV